jgi:hypothetical protein
LLLASASYNHQTPPGAKAPLDLGRDFAPIVLRDRAVRAGGSSVGRGEEPRRAGGRWPRPGPGKLNYASSGIGTPPHLAGELFKSMAGIDVVHVPFREANAALNAVVSGSVEMMFSIASTAARR